MIGLPSRLPEQMITIDLDLAMDVVRSDRCLGEIFSRSPLNSDILFCHTAPTS
jgi:hypothetical protein